MLQPGRAHTHFAVDAFRTTWLPAALSSSAGTQGMVLMPLWWVARLDLCSCFRAT